MAACLHIVGGVVRSLPGGYWPSPNIVSGVVHSLPGGYWPFVCRRRKVASQWLLVPTRLNGTNERVVIPVGCVHHVRGLPLGYRHFGLASLLGVPSSIGFLHFFA